MTSSAATGFDLKALAIPAYGPAFFFGAAEGILLPVIPATAHSRGASLAVAAFIAMLLGLGSWVSNVPAGVITERFGERKALLGAGVIGVIGCAIALIPTIASLMLGMVILGVASSVYLLARQKYLTEAVAPSYRARALSLLAGVMRMGVFTGPLVGTFAVRWWGTAAAYAGAVVFLLLATTCALMMQDLPSHTSATTQRARTVDIARDHAPVFATVGVGILLVSAVRAIRQVIIPLWCAHIGLDGAQSSAVYAVSGALDMLVFYPAGKIMDVRGRAWVAVPAMTIMAIALLLMPLAHSMASATVISSLLGFGNGIGSGMVMTLGADFSPDDGRATFLGLWRQLGDTGTTLGPLALSGITAFAGLSPAVIVSAAFGFLGAGMLGVWPSRLEKQGWGRGRAAHPHPKP